MYFANYILPLVSTSANSFQSLCARIRAFSRCLLAALWFVHIPKTFEKVKKYSGGFLFNPCTLRGKIFTISLHAAICGLHWCTLLILLHKPFIWNVVCVGFHLCQWGVRALRIAVFVSVCYITKFKHMVWMIVSSTICLQCLMSVRCSRFGAFDGMLSPLVTLLFSF